jgi:hypothetical protein
MAALFLFRHYLELTLKEIVFGARSLERKDKTLLREWHSGRTVIIFGSVAKFE